MFMQYMAKNDAILQNQAASLRNLETQIGELAIAVSSRPQGNLPSNTEMNPKEQCNVITLRSRKQIEQTNQSILVNTPPLASSPSTSSSKQPVQPQELSEKYRVEPEKPKSKLFPDNPEPYVPPLPFPQRFYKHNMDKQFSKFLDVFKKLHINITFAEMLAQSPNYVKFLKEILSNKRKLEEYETVALTEECSAILQKKLPPKLKDPGSFNIPCTIGNSFFDKALCDLGASINLMPLSVYKKLVLGEVKPTTVSLQLSDRFIKYPR
ncbi:hypothetical protein TorRG33x02_333160, partial [Trema orientale]